MLAPKSIVFDSLNVEIKVDLNESLLLKGYVVLELEQELAENCPESFMFPVTKDELIRLISGLNNLLEEF